MNITGHPYLSRLLNNDEAWAQLGDVDALMKSAEERLQSTKGASDAGEAAGLMQSFARDHYHLLLVGQFKLKEIARGIGAALESRNETAMLNLARAFIEHTAALAYQVQMLEKGTNEFPKKADFKDLRKTIARHREAASKLYYNKSAAIHVHDMIKALATLYEPIRREYDALCEFVHPNFGSNRLVSSGALGAGQIRSHAEELNDELVTTHQIIERCAMLLTDDLAKTASYYLMKLGSWIETACQDGTKLSQIFSVRGAISGDGKSKETALFFKKARTHHEAMEAFYAYLRTEKVDMLGRRNAGVQDGYLYDEVTTAAGPFWVKYKLQ